MLKSKFTNGENYPLVDIIIVETKNGNFMGYEKSIKYQKEYIPEILEGLD